ncbi:MAG: hypothetical protein P1V97_00590 [Planctomycetota bacterium]|nr:hypothetical protein [Planctomycetota bacterium]
MRAWLLKWGIKIRRFPVWLQIFNAIILVTLLSIASAGLYFLTPQSKSTDVFLIEGRLNHQFVIDRVQRGDRLSLTAELKKVPVATQESLVREIGALCEARIGPLLLECAEQDIARNASLASFERWRLAFQHKREFPEGSKELDQWLQELSEAERFLPLAAESLIFGDILARRLAVHALAERNDPSSSALLVYALRAPFFERGIQSEAFQALQKWFGDVDEKLSWTEIIAHFESKAADLPAEISQLSWDKRIENGLNSENIHDLRAAFLAMNLLGRKLQSARVEEQFSSPYSLPREFTRGLIMLGSPEDIEHMWGRLPRKQWDEALLISAQYSRGRPTVAIAEKIKETLNSEKGEATARLKAAWLTSCLAWDPQKNEGEILAVYSKNGGEGFERQILLRDLKRLRRATARMILEKIAAKTVVESDRLLAKRLLSEITSAK